MRNPLTTIFKDEKINGVAYKNKALKKGILSLLNENGYATIAEFCKKLNISTPKAVDLINALTESGILKEEGKIDSTGGRPAAMYALAPDAAYFVGVDVKKYGINIGLLDFRKNLVLEKHHIPFTLKNTQDALEFILSVIEKFLTEANIRREKISGIGINLTGRINKEKGYSYSYFNFQEDPLAVVLEKRLGIPCYLENDSRAFALAEFNRGVVKDEKDILYIYMDYGLGLGIFVNGKVYNGKSGFSGEFGHIPCANNEIICHCGKKGCLETEGSGYALIRLFKDRLKDGHTTQLAKKYSDAEQITLQDIIQAAKNDDTLSIELIAEIGEKIGRGIAVLINIFNPELVILGGLIAESGDYIRLPVKSAINKYSLSLVNNDSQLKMAALEENAGVIGACLTARDMLFR